MEFENYTRKKLIQYCQKNKIKKYSRKRNAQIIEIIINELKKRKLTKKSDKAFVFPSRSWKIIISFCKGMKKRKKIKQRSVYDEETLINALDILYPIFNDKKLKIGKDLRNVFGTDCYDICINNKSHKRFSRDVLHVIRQNIPGQISVFYGQINARTKLIHKVSDNITDDYLLSPNTLSRKYKQQQRCKISAMLKNFMMPYFKYAFQDPYATNFVNVVNKNEKELQNYEYSVPRIKKQWMNNKDEHYRQEKTLKKLRKEAQCLDMDEELVMLVDEELVIFKIVQYYREDQIVVFSNEIYGECRIPVNNKNWCSNRKITISKLLKIQIQIKNIAANVIIKFFQGAEST
tara:strand:- start:74 stop:1114 length:1041 start_codon:yes stop_codon:yes gene_type:complete